MTSARPDLRLLKDTWLSDEHVNLWMQHIIQQSYDRKTNQNGKENTRKDIAMLDSIIMEVIEKGRALDSIVGKRHAELRLDEASRLVIPVHVGGNHWILIVVLLRRHCICVYDSFRSCLEPRRLSMAAHRKADAIRQFLYAYGAVNGVLDFWRYPWIVVACGFTTPQTLTKDRWNCGIYALLAASICCEKGEDVLVDKIMVMDIESARMSLVAATKKCNKVSLPEVDWTPICESAGLSCSRLYVKSVHDKSYTIPRMDVSIRSISEMVNLPLYIPVCYNPLLKPGRPLRLCSSMEKAEAIRRAMRYRRIPCDRNVSITHTAEGHTTTLGDAYRFDFPFVCSDTLYMAVTTELVIKHLCSGIKPDTKSTAPLVIVMNGTDDLMLTAHYVTERLLETYYDSCDFIMVGNTFSDALSVLRDYTSLATSSALDSSFFFAERYPYTQLPRTSSDAVNEISCVDSVVALASRFPCKNFRLWRANDTRQVMTFLRNLPLSTSNNARALPCVVFVNEPAIDCNWLAKTEEIHVYNILVMWNYAGQAPPQQQQPELGKRKRIPEEGESSGGEEERQISSHFFQGLPVEPMLYCELFYYFYSSWNK